MRSSKGLVYAVLVLAASFALSIRCRLLQSSCNPWNVPHRHYNFLFSCSSSQKQFDNIKKKADDATQKGAILEERHRAAVNTLSKIQAGLDGKATIQSAGKI